MWNYREGGGEGGRAAGDGAGGGGGEEAVQAMSTARTLHVHRHAGLTGEVRPGRCAGHTARPDVARAPLRRPEQGTLVSTYAASAS